MSSAQPASDVMEPSQQQMTQSTYQGSAAASSVQAAGGTTGNTGGGTMTGQPQTAGYVGQQALPGTQQQQQQQTFNPSSRFVRLLHSSYMLPMCCLFAVYFALESS